MISDVLSDAVDTIRKSYLDNPLYDSVYTGGFRQQLEELLDDMDNVRMRLDIVSAASGVTIAVEMDPVERM